MFPRLRLYQIRTLVFVSWLLFSAVYLVLLRRSRQVGGGGSSVVEPGDTPPIPFARPDQFGNLLINPSFEYESSTTVFPHTDDEHYEDRRFFCGWEPFLDPYFVDTEVAHWGARSLRVEASVGSDKYIVGQHVLVSPDHGHYADASRDALPWLLTLSAYHMTRSVHGASSEGLALVVDVQFRNNTRSYGNAVQLEGGSHGWSRVCRSWVLQPMADCPVAAMSVFLIWSEHLGYAWLDDVRLTLQRTAFDESTTDDAPCSRAPPDHLSSSRLGFGDSDDRQLPVPGSGARSTQWWRPSSWFPSSLMASSPEAAGDKADLPTSSSSMSLDRSADDSVAALLSSNLPVGRLSKAVEHGCCAQRVPVPAQPRGTTPDGNTADTTRTQFVSLVTQLTVDRLPALIRMVSAWQGPVSAAVYLFDKRDEAEFRRARDQIAGGLLAQFVDFVLVPADGGRWSFQHLGLYPVNTLRNAAMANARSTYGVIVDVDFVLSETCAQFSRRLASQVDGVERPVAFVVPAFELIQASEQLAGTFRLFDQAAKEKLELEMQRLAANLPRGRSHVERLVRAGQMRQVHEDKYEVAHGATDYERWFGADQPYQVAYQFEYEPYVVVKLADAPRFDERFVGYGFDKVVHSAAMHYSGYQFVVLPDVFVVHVDHGVPSWRDRAPMLRIRVHQHYFSLLNELAAIHAPLDYWQNKTHCTDV